MEIVLEVGVACAVDCGKIFLLQDLSFPQGIVALEHCYDVGHIVSVKLVLGVFQKFRHEIFYQANLIASL